jgi:hypothetical protein
MARLVIPALGAVALLCLGSERGAGPAADPGAATSPPSADRVATGNTLSSEPVCGPHMLPDRDVCVRFSLGDEEPLFGHMGAQAPAAERGALLLGDP